MLRSNIASARGGCEEELPAHEFVRAIEAGWGAFVVRQIIVYWRRGISALNMKFWIEHSHGEQFSIDAPHAVARNLSEKVRPAAFAPGARARPQCEGIGLSAFQQNSLCCVQATSISFTVNGLAVIAMTEILHQGSADEAHLHGPARALDGGVHRGYPAQVAPPVMDCPDSASSL